MNEFVGFPKLSRLFRPIVVTEKLDGTNAQVFVSEDLSEVRAGSRNRWLTVNDDNYGFAGWVKTNEDDLRNLGPGRHFGEWWGQGIQRNYGLKEKRFSLFNVNRWHGEGIPKCCFVVPTLYTGDFSEDEIDKCMGILNDLGSAAAPGFMNAEGVVIFHTVSSQLFKYTLDNNDNSKWASN